jgi:hypothetical protein
MFIPGTSIGTNFITVVVFDRRSDAGMYQCSFGLLSLFLNEHCAFVLLSMDVCARMMILKLS